MANDTEHRTLTSEQHRAFQERFGIDVTPNGGVNLGAVNAVFHALLVAEARAAYWEATADKIETIRVEEATDRALQDADRACNAAVSKQVAAFAALSALGVGPNP